MKSSRGSAKVSENGRTEASIFANFHTAVHTGGVAANLTEKFSFVLV